MSTAHFDLCVIGGGINGAGIARDAAGRGLSVLLVEAKDLAQGTSSASTKLIHGGLRYLEFLEFALVRHSLQERERLLSIAPHLISPMNFILPYSVHRGRPLWMIRLGLFLYDHLAKRVRLPASQQVSLVSGQYGTPLADFYRKGFRYSDCWVDDSRLVVLNALDAAERGAQIWTHIRCVRIASDKEGWRLSLWDEQAGREFSVQASMVVNAAGPWVQNILEDSGFYSTSLPMPRVRHVKGSHLIVARRFEGDHAYILQQEDKRIVFAIPYEKDFTLIGTTEEAFDGDLYDVRISDSEVDYLCGAYSQHFKKPLKREDVLWSYSGVRPLFDVSHRDGRPAGDMRSASRDYILYRHPGVHAPLLSVFGGKLTTYRVLAEKVMDKLLLGREGYGDAWSSEVALPGGDFAGGHFRYFVKEQARIYPWVARDVLLRYARSYGTRMERFLDGARSVEDLGRHYGAGLYQAEILYMVRYEWARSVEDVLWRRSKLGLHMSEAEVAALERAFPSILREVGL